MQAERLEYFELLMQACEKRGLNKAAAQFAHAAVAELLTAFPQNEGGAAERDHRAGRIWTNLFAFALDEDDFEVRSLLWPQPAGELLPFGGLVPA